MKFLFYDLKILSDVKIGLRFVQKDSPIASEFPSSYYYKKYKCSSDQQVRWR